MEVVEHLVNRAPPSCINGVYWRDSVCRFKGFAGFGFLPTMVCRVCMHCLCRNLDSKNQRLGEKYRYFFLSLLLDSVLCKFVVFKTHDRVLLYFVQTTKFCPSFFSDQKPIIEFQLDYGAMIDFLFFVIVVKYIGAFKILSSLFKMSYFTAMYIQQTNAPCWNMDKQIVKILSYLGFSDIMDCFINLKILWGMVKP